VWLVVLTMTSLIPEFAGKDVMKIGRHFKSQLVYSVVASSPVFLLYLVYSTAPNAFRTITVLIFHWVTLSFAETKVSYFILRPKV